MCKPFINEARESSLVPEGFLTAQFLQKLWFGLVTLELSACMQPPELTKIPDSGLPWLWNLGIKTANRYHPLKLVYVR